MARARTSGRSPCTRTTARRTRAASALLWGVGLAAVFLLAAALGPSSALAQGGIGQEDPLTEWFVDTYQRFLGGGGAAGLVGADSPMTAPVFWLVSVPNYTARAGSPLELEGFTSAIGLAMLAAVVTLAIIGHWAAGFAGQGSDVLTGLTRSLGAGLFILAWPWIFGSGVALVNGGSHALIGDSTAEISRLLVSVVALHETLGTSGALAGVLAIAAPVLAVVMGLLAVVLMLLWLLLALAKIGFNAGLVLVFVATPITVALWPVPGFAWLAQWGLKAGTALAVIPLAWALLMAAAVAVGAENLLADPVGVTGGTLNAAESEGAGAAALNTMSQGLVALALIVMMLKLPGMILRTAGVSSDGRGFVAGMASYTASQFAFSAMSRHVPAALGGARGATGGRPSSPRPGPRPTAPRPSSRPTAGTARPSAGTAPAATGASTSTPGSTSPRRTPAVAGAATSTPGAASPRVAPVASAASASTPAPSSSSTSAPGAASTTTPRPAREAGSGGVEMHQWTARIGEGNSPPPPTNADTLAEMEREGFGGARLLAEMDAKYGNAYFEGEKEALAAPSPEALIDPGRMSVQAGDEHTGPSSNDESES